jgi:integrase
MQSLGQNLFIQKRVYYGRFKIGGKWRQRALGEFPSVTAARDKLAEKSAETSAERTAENGRGAEIVAEQRTAERIGFSRQRTAEIVLGYQAAGYPTGRYRRKRQSRVFDLSVKHLVTFFGDMSAETINQADLDDYSDYRKAASCRKNIGDRASEIDLQVLSSAFNWAVRGRKLRVNPIKQRERYQDPADVVHCTEKMPMSAEELHDIAENLSPVFQHQCLLEAYTGGRTSEILKLRLDAAHRTPGYYNEDYLWLDRSKGGINPYVVMHEPLKGLLEHIREYQAKNNPMSKYMLTGKDGIFPPSRDSLTQALRSTCKRMGLRHVCSHGLRAYYVRVCRSKGLSDTEIAIRLGQRSGVRLVETTYGMPEPNWIGQNKLDFVPKDAPAAWER